MRPAVSAGKFWWRALTVCVGLPLFYVLIFLLPHFNHLALNAALVLATAAGALEVEKLLEKKGTPAFRGTAFASAALPTSSYLLDAGIITGMWFIMVFMALVGLLFLRTLWVRRSEELAPLLVKLSSSLLVLVYPGLFLSFLVLLSGLPNSNLLLFLFFALVFSNDMLAYIAGSLSGGPTRLGYVVSPNKSAVGFAAGFLTSIAVALLFRALFPNLMPIGLPAAAGFGAGIGALTILGDLVESALKRSAQVKDSSGIIPGRGGILDSIDSWLLSAPVFYFVLKIIQA